MKKVFTLTAITAVFAATLLPALVSGKKSQQPGGAAQGGQETVQYMPEVQTGEHAVSAPVRNMPRGKDKGKHLAQDKDYRPHFNPDGLTRLGYTVDPVVQTAASDSSATPLVAPSSPSSAQDAPSPNGTTQL